MSVDPVVCVEKRDAGLLWIRAEEKVDNPYKDFPELLEEFPASLRKASVPARWDLRAEEWLSEVDHQFTNGIDYRGIPVDASTETIDELEYWTDPEVGRSWLTLMELERIDWTEINQRHNVKILKRGILDQLRSAGKPNDVRIVYGWNV